MANAARLQGLVIMVTGGASGMGAEHCRAFVEAGAHVVAADVNEANLLSTAKDLGAACTPVKLDVADEASWEAAVVALRAQHGRLDVLVNNAAIVLRSPIAETSVAEFRRILDVNLVGAFMGIRAVAPLMAEGGGGSIINISSTSGVLGFPNLSAYGAAKWGVRGLTKMAAAELAATGIRVNTVVPGLVETPMTRALNRRGGSLRGRPAVATEISSLLIYLASDESGFVTGADFMIDGGETAVSRTTLVDTD